LTLLPLQPGVVAGVAPDVEKELGPDPSILICKQLGVQLHALGSALPLFDMKSGKVMGDTQDSELQRYLGLLFVISVPHGVVWLLMRLY
jgi:hypothetical protein